MSALSIPFTIRLDQWLNKKVLLPVLAGIVATLAMVGMYLAILTVFQDWKHATEQLTADRWIVLLVALGFGVQIGLYTYLRVLIHGAQAASATAATGAGAGTSTLGMVACCAHHLTDLAPLVALAGASSLSGAISFLTEYKYAFIGLGLVMNAIGMVVTLRTIRKSREHLKAMAVQVQDKPACH